MIILGIDPGIATLGYGVLEADKGKFLPVDYGVGTTPKGVVLPKRLEMPEEGVVALFDRFCPDEVAGAEKFLSQKVSQRLIGVEGRGGGWPPAAGHAAGAAVRSAVWICG